MGYEQSAVDVHDVRGRVGLSPDPASLPTCSFYKTYIPKWDPYGTHLGSI